MSSKTADKRREREKGSLYLSVYHHWLTMGKCVLQMGRRFTRYVSRRQTETDNPSRTRIRRSSHGPHPRWLYPRCVLLVFPICQPLHHLHDPPLSFFPSYASSYFLRISLLAYTPETRNSILNRNAANVRGVQHILRLLFPSSYFSSPLNRKTNR